MARLPTRDTQYGDYVRFHALAALRSRGGGYSATDLAALMGLKCTGNFRRRLNALVQAGVLQSKPCALPSGHMVIVYLVGQYPDADGSIPF